MLGFKGLSSNISYFVAILSFVARSALLHDMYCILYRIKFANLQLAQKQCICRENSKYAPDKNFVAILALAEKLPTSATLDVIKLSSF